MIWRVITSPHVSVTLHDFQTRYDVNDLYDFIEALDIVDVLQEEAAAAAAKQ